MSDQDQDRLHIVNGGVVLTPLQLENCVYNMVRETLRGQWDVKTAQDKPDTIEVKLIKGGEKIAEVWRFDRRTSLKALFEDLLGVKVELQMISKRRSKQKVEDSK